jgi:acetyltransferase-like isoleucine patch superfamily enzyme
MKSLYNLLKLLKAYKYRCKGILLKVFLRLLGCKTGSKLICKQFPKFRILPFKNLEIGNNVIIGYNITFEVYPKGYLLISDAVEFTQDILVSCTNKITIGSFTGIAERVSIRDSDHSFRKDRLLRLQEEVSAPIYIGKDVHIGLGTSVFMGANISDGAVIGPNSIIARNTEISAYGIYLSYKPVKFLRKRV